MGLIFAPIFVPMFLLLDYHPGFTQIIYRLGDSAGNLFAPPPLISGCF